MAKSRKEAPSVQPKRPKEEGPHPIDVHVGARVKLRRMILGYSQEAIGKKLGLTFQQIQKYEKGVNRIGASRIFELAQLLDVPIQFFYDDYGDAAGGTAVRIAGGEVYTSMQTGVIDAVEWVGPYNDRTLGLNEVAEFYYYPGWHEPGALLEFTVNAKAFAKLSPDLQAIVRAAARAANQDMLDEFTARNNESLQQLLQAGTKLRPLPDDILALLYEKSLVAMAKLRAADPRAEKIARSYDAFATNVRAYHEISERAYLNARDKVLPPVMPEPVD